eukprot:470550-Hanusia_phi.AAC.3
MERCGKRLSLGCFSDAEACSITSLSRSGRDGSRSGSTQPQVSLPLMLASLPSLTFLVLPDEYTGEWEWEKGYSDVSEDYGLKMGSAGQKHALSSAFEKAIEVQDSTFVVQYEVDYLCVKATNGLACDGAYIKLLQKGSAKQLSKFDNNVRYTIMFGPDRCGSTDKVHFILQHQNPVTKQWEEKVKYAVEKGIPETFLPAARQRNSC